jgi:hypothetical protein
MVADPQIVEASGLAVSRMHDGVLWVHNDSGDGARVFAIDREGVTLAEIDFPGTLALDWEDMAIGPGPEPGVDYLYFGDIGDNGEIRATISVYRVAEPDPADGDATIDDVTAIVLDYPDGSHNAETLLVDPETADILVVTKERSGESGVFRAAAPRGGGETIDLEQIGTLGFGSALLPGNTLTTGGDIAADGSLIAIRTYNSAFAWRRVAGASLADAFATEPCPLPLEREEQGETLALAVDGMLTISEGVSQPVWFFARQ